MASTQSAFDEDLVNLLSSGRPSHLEASMFKTVKPAEPVSVQPAAGISSIGLIDSLPPELLRPILESLDFQSLSRFSQVSHLALDLVQSLPAFRDLMQHAPHALAVLVHTRLVSHFPSSLVYATLQSQSCTFCGQYGAYLSLPTCKRCCYACTETNPLLWTMERAEAAACFALSKEHMATLPTMLIHDPKLLDEEKLTEAGNVKMIVSVEAVKRLALVIHGSESQIQILAAHCQPESPIQACEICQGLEFKRHNIIRKSSLGPIDINPLGLSSLRPQTSYSAYIPLPSLVDGQLEHGHWCSGCSWIFENRDVESVLCTLSISIPSFSDYGTFLQGLSHQGRSKDNFLKHAGECFGIPFVCEGLGITSWLPAIQARSESIHQANKPARWLYEA